MRPQTSKRINKQGERSYRYLCELAYKSKKERCHCVSVNGNLLDKMVMDEILKLSSEKSTLLDDLQTMLKTNQTGTLQSQIKEIETQNAKINREIKKLVTNMAAIEDADIVKEITQAIAERRRAIEANEQKLEELNALLTTQDQESKSIDELIKYLTDFPKLLAEANFDQKRAALRKIIHSVYYDSDKKMITINLIASNSPTSVYLPDVYKMKSSCISVPAKNI